MATGTLEGSTIASTYKSLLKVKGGANTELHATTHQLVEDGHGNDSVLSLAIDSVGITGSGSRLYFSDKDGEYISGNGSVLSIVGGSEIDLTATAIDLNGTLDVSGTLTQGGASQFNSTITVGVDNTGYDVKLFGATSGAYALWDESADNLILAGGAGIVEAGGALKENLLTNSGFDVWSNSTLENVGSDLVTNGTFADGGTWSLGTNVSITGGVGRFASVPTGQQMYQTISITSGKLYKVTFTISGYSAGGVKIYVSSGSIQSTPFAANGTHTYVAEDDGDDNYLSFVADGTTTLDIDNVSVYEVTPGCVAADTDGPDGWSKQSGMRVYRKEWIDVGHASNTVFSKDGSYYALYNPTNDAADKTLFGGVNLNSSGQEIEIERFLGRTITIGAWVYAKASSHASISVHDNVNSSSTAFHSGSAGWEWLEATHTVATNATTLYSFRYTSSLKAGSATDPPSTNADEVWMSQPMLVFGSSIGEGNYTRPNQEIVYLDGECALTDLNDSSFSTGTGSFNLEVESRGKLPKSTKAIVNARISMKDSGSSGANVRGYLYPAGSGYENGWAFNIGNSGLTLADDDEQFTSFPYMRTVDAGMTYNFTVSGSSTFDIEMWVRAIEI